MRYHRTRQERIKERKDFRDAQLLLEDARLNFRKYLMFESAMMANSLDPQYRSAGRRVLGAFDYHQVPAVSLDDGTMRRVRGMKKAIFGDNKSLDHLAKEIINDEEVDEDVKKVAAKVVCFKCIALIKKHLTNPDKGPKEEELVEALERVDKAILISMKEEIRLIAERSPFEEVKRAAMAILVRLG